MVTIADALRAPAALLRLDRRSAAWGVLYLALAGALLFGFACWVEAHQHDLRGLVLDYLFPKDWHFAAGALVDLYWAKQAQIIVAGVVLGGGLALVSLLLFPVKEQLSASFERARGLTDAPIHEHPLWRQALEEVGLFVLYLTAQMVVLRLSYTADATRVQLAVALNAHYLATSVGIDFIAPVLQRHRHSYFTILRLLARHPLVTLTFGAIFALPALAAGKLVSNDDVGTWLYAMFGVQVASIAWAAVAGTWLGARLLPAARALPPPWRPGQALVLGAILTTFALNATWFGQVGAAIHHKSQLLKCDYAVDWTSLRLDRPSVLGMLAAGQVSVGVRLDLRVHNPTAFDLVVEANHLDIRHDGTRVSTSRLAPFAVSAGETRRVPFGFEIGLDPRSLMKGRALLEDRYTFVWSVEVAPGVEVPIPLR